MSPLRLINTPPIELTVSIDSAGELAVHHQGTPLANHDDSIKIENQNLPLRVSLLDAAQSGVTWVVNASHEDGAGVTQTWNRHNNQGRCSFDWDVTQQFRKVEVTATAPAAASKVKLILVKVRPHPEQ